MPDTQETPHGAERPHNFVEIHALESVDETHAQLKEKHEEMKKKEEISKKRDEQIAKRNLDYPDLQEVLKILQPQLRVVKGFLDGSLHAQRARQAQNRVILIPEFQQQLDQLNRQMGDLRNNFGMQFRTSDVWAAFNDMPMSPAIMHLRFPPDPHDDYLKNLRNGAMCRAQNMHLRIDTNGLSIVDERQAGAETPTTQTFDTLLFYLRTFGRVDNGRILGIQLRTFFALTGSDTATYWRETLPQRARSYGMPVGIINRDDGVRLFIDLRPVLGGNEERYLDLSVTNPGGVWRPLADGGVRIVTGTPPAGVRFE